MCEFQSEMYDNLKSKWIFILCNTFLIYDICFEAQNSKHHQSCQHRSEKIDEGHQNSIKMAVVVSLVVAWKGNDSTESKP